MEDCKPVAQIICGECGGKSVGGVNYGKASLLSADAVPVAVNKILWSEHNDGNLLVMYIFTRGRIQTKSGTNWLQGRLYIISNMSSLLTM